MPRSKLAALKQQLRDAEEDVQLKAQQLEQLKSQVSQARVTIQKLEGEVSTNAALEDDVQTLLRHQQETAAAFMDYENRVLALELQGLVDRWRTMDVDELAQQNHELRQECLRLQQENMELSRAVTENSLSARRDLAKIEMALELTVKQKMREMHDRLRQELYDEMDDKTKKMVAEHGYLQDFVRDQAAQAATLDRHCRMLQADRNRLKVDSDVATGLSEQQAVQAVTLRKQLRQAFQTVEALQRRLAESEARAQAAWDEAVRASSRAAVAAAAAARAGLHSQQQHGEVDGDSAYGMAGEGAEVAALESQLRHAKQRFERMRLQRDRWRDRSTLYEKACAQLQAALQTLQDQARMTLPGGVKQDLDAIWCAAKAVSDPDGGGGGGGGVWVSRPSTPQFGSGATTPQGGGGGCGDTGFGYGSPQGSSNGAWAAAGGGVMAVGGAKGRAASARVLCGTATRRNSVGLPARPQTAAPVGGPGGTGWGSGGGTAAVRAAEAIRAAVNLPPSSSAGDGAGVSSESGRRAGGAGGGAGQGGEGAADAAAAEWTEEQAGPPRSSSPPPGRIPMSRLYSNDAEPYKVVPRIQYDQTGWPVVPEIRPTSPTRAASGGPPHSTTAAAGGSGRPGTPLATTAASPATTTSASAAAAAAAAAAGSPFNVPPGPRRAPGSLRPHSALPTEPAAAPTPKWTPGRSLTGLTGAVDAAGAAADSAAGDGGKGGGDAQVAHAASTKGGAAEDEQGDAQPQQQQPQPQLRRQISGPAGEGPAGPASGRVAGSRSGAAATTRTSFQAADADWQAWQTQRERSQSPELAAIARSAAAAAAAAAAADSAVLRRPVSGDRALDDASRVTERSPASVAPPDAVPEVGLSGGALYTVVHSITAQANASPATGALPPSNGVLSGLVAARGGPGASYLYGNGAAGHGNAAAAGGGGSSPSLSGFRPPAIAINLGGPPGPAMSGNPSALLAAMRRPSSNTGLKRLHNPDILFTGARAASARGGSGGAAVGLRSLTAANTVGVAGVARAGAGAGAGAGGGAGVAGGSRASSTGSMSSGL